MRPAATAPVITAIAAVSPVGHNAVQTCAALRAGISRFGEHPFYQPRLADPPLGDPEFARVSFVAGPGVAEPLGDRLMRLALFPTRELIASAKIKRVDLPSLMLFPCLPSTAGSRPAVPSADDFAARFVARVELGPTRVARVRHEGSTGMIAAAAEAAARLQTGEARFALILGVDSYLDAATMAWLDETQRLRSERNVDGFVPGEAAVMLLLETEAGARTRHAPVLARLNGLCEARESNTILSDKFATGAGLTEAVERALGPRTAVACALWPIADVNGESYRAQEWGLIQSRLGERLGSATPLWHPADCVGDVGAASAGLHMALACHAFARKNAPAQTALVWSSSDGGKRAACVLQPPA